MIALLLAAALAARPTLQGEPGETAPHLYARLVAKACVSDETEHVIAQVEQRIAACRADGQSECERKTCDALRRDAPGRCLSPLEIASADSRR